MKNIAIVIAAVIIFAAPAARAALVAPSIAIVDQIQVLEKSDAVKGIEKQFEGRRKALKDELVKQDNALKAAADDLKKKSAAMAPDAFKKERDGFEAKVAEAQKKMQDMKASLDADYGKLMGVVQKNMLQIIADIAKEDEVNLVLSNQQVIMFAPEIDITAEVVKRLNAKLPKVDPDMAAKPEKAPKAPKE